MRDDVSEWTPAAASTCDFRMILHSPSQSRIPPKQYVAEFTRQRSQVRYLSRPPAQTPSPSPLPARLPEDLPEDHRGTPGQLLSMLGNPRVVRGSSPLYGAGPGGLLDWLRSPASGQERSCKRCSRSSSSTPMACRPAGSFRRSNAVSRRPRSSKATIPTHPASVASTKSYASPPSPR